jgi:hypothetical protein
MRLGWTKMTLLELALKEVGALLPLMLGLDAHLD